MHLETTYIRVSEWPPVTAAGTHSGWILDASHREVPGEVSESKHLIVRTDHFVGFWVTRGFFLKLFHSKKAQNRRHLRSNWVTRQCARKCARYNIRRQHLTQFTFTRNPRTSTETWRHVGMCVTIHEIKYLLYCQNGARAPPLQQSFW